MLPKLEDQYGDGDWAVLVCPSCGFRCTHHDSAPVEVWQRPEDGDQPGVAVQPDGDVRPIPPGGNPSSRRSGVALHFWCEGCGDYFMLTIAQHKGNTLVAVHQTDGHPAIHEAQAR